MYNFKTLGCKFKFTHKKISSRDSSVGIATGWTAGSRFSAGARDFSLLHIVQTSSVVYPSYAMDIGGSFFGSKAA
jgi:hypothetical protein